MASDIRTASLASIYPPAIAADPEAARMALALDAELQQVATDTDLARLLPRIETLTDTVLDLVAWQYRLLRYIGWDTASLARKRATLARALGLYRKAGTRRGIRAALAILGVGAEIVAWWEEARQPFTYRVTLLIGPDGLTFEMYTAALELLDAYASCRDHLSEVAVSLTTSTRPAVDGELRVTRFTVCGPP